MGKKKHSVDVLFMFVLFAVFTVLSVLIIYIGSGVYEKISENKEINQQARTTLSYVVNKVRGGNGVYITENSGIQVLAVKSDLNETAIETLIYEYDGRLMEMTVAEGDVFELQFGDRLMDTDGVKFYIDQDKNILSVRVTDNSGRDSSVSVYLGRSVEQADLDGEK